MSRHEFNESISTACACALGDLATTWEIQL
jgi:hypothetical protein